MRLTLNNWWEIVVGVLLIFLVMNLYTQHKHIKYSEKITSIVISNQQSIIGNQQYIISNQHVIISNQVVKLNRP